MMPEQPSLLTYHNMPEYRSLLIKTTADNTLSFAAETIVFVLDNFNLPHSDILLRGYFRQGYICRNHFSQLLPSLNLDIVDPQPSVRINSASLRRYE
jgi:hypothetical protein